MARIAQPGAPSPAWGHWISYKLYIDRILRMAPCAALIVPYAELPVLSNMLNSSVYDLWAV